MSGHSSPIHRQATEPIRHCPLYHFQKEPQVLEAGKGSACTQTTAMTTFSPPATPPRSHQPDSFPESAQLNLVRTLSSDSQEPHSNHLQSPTSPHSETPLLLPLLSQHRNTQDGSPSSLPRSGTSHTRLTHSHSYSLHSVVSSCDTATQYHSNTSHTHLRLLPIRSNSSTVSKGQQPSTTASDNTVVPALSRSSPPKHITTSPDHGRSTSPRQSRTGNRSSFLAGPSNLTSPAFSPIFPLVFQPSLELSILRFASPFARLHFLVSPLLLFAHIPVTLFLDYNVLYALAQIALHPTPSNIPAGNPNISGQPRAIPYWIALGFYAASTLIWLIALVIIYEVWYSYFRTWRKHASSYPTILSVYTSALAFNLACLRSYQMYCCL